MIDSFYLLQDLTDEVIFQSLKSPFGWSSSQSGTRSGSLTLSVVLFSAVSCLVFEMLITIRVTSIKTCWHSILTAFKN